jgi:hypothetical protein
MSDIRNILEVICKQANEYLQNIYRRNDDWVVLSSIVDHNGGVNESIKDKIVMTVYNITRENMVSTFTPARPGGDAYAIVSPPIYINLHLMFMANFSEKNYSEGLAAISILISFFQQRPYFTPANTPDLHPGVHKLTLEMENLTPVDVNYVMGILGTKYLPSAFYKLRLLPFDSNAMWARTYGAMGLGISESPQSGVL